MIHLLLGALLFAPQAHAYKLLGYAWSAEDFPIQWYITDYVEDSLENAPSYGFESTHDYQIEAVSRSMGNWYTADCAAISDEFMGIDPGNEGKTNDGVEKVYFDDPAGYHGAGILAVASYNVTAEYLREQDGQYLYRFGDVDITFNDDIDWAIFEEVEDNACSGSMVSIEPVATHEFGHFWGLGHSCDEGESCTDEDLIYATMMWQIQDSCSNEASSINADDISGINALYGPFATFTTDSERFGGVPLTVDFELKKGDDTNVTSVLWDFGDGKTSTEFSPSHTYETQGQFTVQLEINGEAEACGDWSFDYRERAYVIACEPPGPGLSPEGESYNGLFTFEHIDGTTYQMINRTDTSVYGCIDTVVWQVYNQSGDMIKEISAWSPKIDFEEDGTYTVLLNVGGPGGMSAGELTIDTAEYAGGCSTVPFGTGLLAIAASLGLALGRRREE